MFIEFDHMMDHSRVWIYTSDREFSVKENELITESCKQFVSDWTAHSVQLLGSCAILKNRFIVLVVDESSHGASGCSIDSSVNFIRSLETNYGLSLLNGGKVAIELNGTTRLLTMKEITGLIASDSITEDTIVYDHLVATIGEFHERWMTNVRQSWLSKFINKKEKV
jgi:hypothetical protein